MSVVEQTRTVNFHKRIKIPGQAAAYPLAITVTWVDQNLHTAAKFILHLISFQWQR